MIQIQVALDGFFLRIKNIGRFLKPFKRNAIFYNILQNYGWVIFVKKKQREIHTTIVHRFTISDIDWRDSYIYQKVLKNRKNL